MELTKSGNFLVMNKLKISINAKRITSAYGGGNQAANALEDYLVKKGHYVYRKLIPNLDVILIFSSKSSFNNTYDYDDILDYIYAYPNTVVIQRVNSCDEQRGTDLGINSSMLRNNQLADYTVFISKFVKELFEAKGMKSQENSQIILNGGDSKIFYPSKSKNIDKKFKIVTHHWSSNFMKGFDIYERLDQLLDTQPFKDLFEFTYIGNMPLGVILKKTVVIEPLFGSNLAEHLRNHHIYLTAARNEAAGMHHIEGMLCGLPVLYLNSGALPEYCKPFGIEYSLINFEEKLMEIKNQYYALQKKVLNCNYTSKQMASQFEKIIIELVSKKRTNPKLGAKKSKVLINKLVRRPYRKIKNLFIKTINYYQR